MRVFYNCRPFGHRHFSTSQFLYEKHPFDKVDRLDSFLDSVSTEDLLPPCEEVFPSKKVRSVIYGLYSYLFSNDMSLSIRADEFEENRVFVVKAVECFLKGLEENTIYKCLFIGVTEEGDIKSSKEGAFFISKNTRAEYIAMKVKNGLKEFAFRYKGLDFDSYTLSYKKWIPTNLIGEYIREAELVLDKISERELRKNAYQEDKENLVLMQAHDISHYNRWIKLVGVIEKCGTLYPDMYLVQQTRSEDGDYKIVVECLDNAESVSWVDTRIEGEGNAKWVRKFSDGVNVYYEGNRYLMFEAGFKTEFWEKDIKEYEYNKNFGSLDIETYSDTGACGDGLQIPYAAGFKDSAGRRELFYVMEGESDYMVLVRMIEALLVPTRNGSTFYVHNLARFDSRLILEALGLMKGVSARLWGRDMNNIFKIRISKKIAKKSINVVLLDSFYMLPFKLDLLGIKFDTDVKKTSFPYTFVRRDSLFYIGPAPSLTHYADKIEMFDYVLLKEKPWDMKSETLKYLANDIECLFQVMHKYNSTVHNDFLVNAVKLSSYSALSKKIYITNFYHKVGIKIPVITGYLESWIRKAYKGGIVDVVQHMVAGAVKYDSNSHYPAAMLNAMPVGVPRVSDIKDLSQIFGFCYAEITAPTEVELACPFLPTTDINGDLHCPRGIWKDVYFSEELKNAVKFGYKVRVLSTVVFDKGVGLFDEFIKEMFKRKADAKEVGDAVGELLYKLTQNSLYGKSGQKEIIHSFKLIDNDRFDIFERTNKTDLQHIFGGKTLVRTQGKIDAELIGVVTKAMAWKESLYESDSDNMGDEESKDIPTPTRKKGSVKSSVSIAAAITAYARIMISQYKNIEGNKYFGGDTDSAIMEKELSPELVGKGLGMMKEECRVAVGLFADKKLYYMQDEKGVSVIKSRGVGRDRERNMDILCYNDFIMLFKGEALKILKNKFLIQSDGIYIKPQAITVRISPERLLKIQEELKAIFLNILHPLFILATEIGRMDIKALTVGKNFACITFNPGYFSQINSLVLFKLIKNSLTLFVLYVNIAGLVLTHDQISSKIYAGITQYVLYIDINGVSLDNQQFSSKINYGVLLYILYVTINGICLPYLQFYSRVYAGIIVYVLHITPGGVSLDSWQFHSKNNYGMIIYNRSPLRGLNHPGSDFPRDACVIFITPSGICLFSKDPRTTYILNNYKIKAQSKRTTFKRAFILYPQNISNNRFTSSISPAARCFTTVIKPFLRIYGKSSNLTLYSYFALRCASYSTKFHNDNSSQSTLWSSSIILTPILASNNDLLAPIIYTPDIKYHINRCDMILSKLSINNKVKQFLIKELEIKIQVYAKESLYTEDIIKHVAQIENYNIERAKIEHILGNSKVITEAHIVNSTPNKIVRNDYSYDHSSFLSFDHNLSTSNLYNISNKTHLYKDKNLLSPDDDGDVNLSTKELILERTPRSSKSTTKVWKILYNGNEINLTLIKNLVKNLDIPHYSNPELISACYAITFNNNLYYYIGSSTNIIQRVKAHNSKIEQYIGNVLRDPRYSPDCNYNTSILPYLIYSEILNNYGIGYKIHPIYIVTNYLRKFQLLYPDYKLSRGEWIILNYATEFILKVLEQSLINKFNPKLNSIKNIGITYWTWLDTYLKEFSNEKSLDKVYGKSVKYLIKHPISIECYDKHMEYCNMHKFRYGQDLTGIIQYIQEGDNYYTVTKPRSENYLIKKYNLNIEEVLDNLNKLHDYKDCTLFSQPMVIEIV